METFFTYILPIILVLLECVFIRTCVEYHKHKTPRAVVFFMIVASLIPILGIIVCIGIPIVIFVGIGEDALELKNNKFNRFWFN